MERSFQIGCNLENLKSIRGFVRESLTGYNCDDHCTDEIVLALDEMCANVMIHAHQCNPGHQIELNIITSSKNQIIFEISDEANLFDINNFEAPDLENLISQKRKGGLGIRLVRTIMTSIEYFERNGRIVCRLTKNLH
ncbi:MAG: ATP-binding protein [Cyclobacteriaceae bacterium]